MSVMGGGIAAVRRDAIASGNAEAGRSERGRQQDVAEGGHMNLLSDVPARSFQRAFAL